MPFLFMEIKVKHVLLICTIFIISVLVYKLFLGSSAVYSNDPKDWLDTTGSLVNVNVRKATAEMSYQNYIGQQFDDGYIDTVFAHDGMYKGNYFQDEYQDNGNIYVKFTQELNPDNGIPEIYMLEKISGGKPVVYIFVDDDWEKNIPSSIIWGDKFQYSRQAKFSEVEKGIYLDSLEDDSDRFTNDFKVHYGGIVVGSITKEDLLNKDFGNAVFVRLR
jgi:hypothetical protein